MRSRICYLFLTLFFASSLVFAQVSQDSGSESVSSAPISSLSDRLNLANTLPDYLVTPGDTFVLNLLTAGGLGTGISSLELFVDEDYGVNMAYLGQVNGRGKTFLQLKTEILQIVRRAYPQSSPSLILTGLGSFQVSITGAVSGSGLLTIDGLTRLNQVFGSRLLPTANTRQISIQGVSRNLLVDYFQYQRHANVAHNPYLRPGDNIVIPFAERLVTISGSVYRPGTYNMLPQDTLQDLIQVYGGGYLDDADPENATLIRNGREQVKEYHNFTDTQVLEGFVVLNLDSYSIPSVQQRTAIYYVEGALAEEKLGTSIETGSLTASGVQPWLRVRKDLIQGTNLLDAVRGIYPLLHQQAAIGDAYLIRNNGEIVPVDMLQILLGASGRDTEIEPFDRIVIPYRQFWVNVTGAVKNPGVIPFAEGQNIQYYLNLSGGINPAAGSGRFELRDQSGNLKPKYGIVEPMHTIHVFEDRFAVVGMPTVESIASIVGIVSGVLSIVVAIIGLTR